MTDSKTSQPSITLASGASMPQIGLGTWKSAPGAVKAAVKHAVQNGYRHIDCALVYGNENEIGEAFKELFAEGVVRREDLFVTSKLWNTYHAAEDVRRGIETTLKSLGLAYLDLYLIHWPHAFQAGDSNFPKDADGNIIYSDAHYKDTWPVMEQCVKDGLTRHIGLSNFNHKQIDEVRALATIQPAVLQVECHPYLTQDKLIAYCKSHGIVVTGYSPLGSPDRPWAKPEDPSLLEDAKIQAVATKYGKTPAQILIRFQVDRGVVVIPKSVTPSRIEQNLDVLDFSLSSEDIATISSFNRGWRACALSRDVAHPLYPFNEEF